MLPIVIYPNSVLSQKSVEVKFPLDDATKQLIKEMWKVVKGRGVGLAAPQVGVNKQICIVHLSEDKALYKNMPEKDFVMINPKVVFFSQVENLMLEGCLSFPDEYWEIWRPANIIVEYFDEKGKKRTLKAKDWAARIIQHEVDHLHGKLFINKGGKKVDPEKLDKSKIVD